MKEIVWSDSFSAGISSIDEQHKNIIRLINRLITSSSTSNPSDSASEALTEMLNYAKEHLIYEEHLLKKHNYPDFENHKAKHLEYVERLVIFSTDAMAEHKSDPEKLLIYLNEWWTHHILHEDMRYRQYLKEALKEKSTSTIY
jgi:hemerythrin